MTAGYLELFLLDWPLSAIASTIFATATVSLLGSWFHDAVHKNTILSPIGRSITKRLIAAPVGFSPLWWEYKHVRLHHKYVGNPEFDPDIQFGYVARVSAAQPWNRTHSSQHIHMWLLYPLAVINMLKPAEIWQRRRFCELAGLGSAPAAWRFVADKYIPFTAVWLPVVFARGPQDAVPIMLTFFSVSGVLASLVTQVQHNTSGSDTQVHFSSEWPLCEQIAQSSDVRVAPTQSVWWWISGGTNYHTIHHLIPSLSFLELPEATRRLQQGLKDHGYDVNCHPSLRAAIMSHARLLRMLSAQNPSTLD